MEAFAYLQLELAQEETSESPPDYNLPDLKGLAGNAQICLVSLISVLLILSTTGETLAQSSNLREGDFNPEVERVESQLRDLGYFNDTPDQFFDLSTTTAVERFQINYGLGVDGIVGPETRGELNELTNISSLPTRSRSTAFDTRNNNTLISTSLSRGRVNDREDVRILQRELNQRRYYFGPIDGIYGPQTESAVRQFQRDNRLRADGVAGQETLEKLGLLVAATIQNQPYVVVVPGDSLEAVNLALETEPRAILARSRRGSYVNAGSFNSRILCRKPRLPFKSERI